MTPQQKQQQQQHTAPLGAPREVGGRSIHVHRTGRGGPAVVFLPGAGAVGLDYLAVQQDVAAFTTAVVYDRAGTGYSDPVPLPRTATAVAEELHALLRAERLPGPVVLAAHSLGGLYAHRLAQLHPEDVAGLVWIDAVHPGWDDGLLAAAEQAAPAPEEIPGLRPELHALAEDLHAVLPEAVRAPLIEAKTSDAWIRAGLAERGTLVPLAAELRAGPALPDVPSLALTAPDTPAPAPPGAPHRVVHGAVHHRICVDQRDAVARAIREVVDAA